MVRCDIFTPPLPGPPAGWDPAGTLENLRGWRRCAVADHGGAAAGPLLGPVRCRLPDTTLASLLSGFFLVRKELGPFTLSAGPEVVRAHWNKSDSRLAVLLKITDM